MLFAKELYVATKNGNTIAISDNIDIINAVASDADKITTIEGIPETDLAKIENFSLIQNDDDKDYGYSEIYYTEDCNCKITLHQLRLDIKNNDYETACSNVEDANKAYCGESNTLRGTIGEHLDFWLKNDESIRIRNSMPDTDIYAYKLSNKDTTLLLKTGFTADNLLLIFD